VFRQVNLWDRAGDTPPSVGVEPSTGTYRQS
jgi:hypothetical protein